MTDISPELLSLLTDLVAIDSVNPGLDSTGAGEAPLADHLATWCGERGLAVTRHGSPERPSLLISTTRGAPGPTLVLCGHLDTVGLAGMSEPLNPRIEGGRMHGRGTYDMKGGLAAALVAAARLDVPEHRGRVVVAAVADEENLSQGTEDVLASLSADAAVVTEPTELEVVTAHRGFAWLTVTAYGVAAHGSRPHLGVDAIVAMGPVLTGLAQLQTTSAPGATVRAGPETLPKASGVSSCGMPSSRSRAARRPARKLSLSRVVVVLPKSTRARSAAKGMVWMVMIGWGE